LQGLGKTIQLIPVSTRYFFEITYNGSAYHGWQNQANAIGVQQVVENALANLLREEIEIVGSGRTDTGVHCTQQFFHADIQSRFEVNSLLVRLNSFLPKDIAIRQIRNVKPDAHARYAAVERSYEYHITQVKNPFLTGYAYYFIKPVDVTLMNRAAALLCGVHDFECFSKVKTDVKNFTCHIKHAQWHEHAGLLVFTITANRFLRGMVRAIVGTLLSVGTGKISQGDFEGILKSKDRKKAGMNVPPEGLYLKEVKYPEAIFIDERPASF
jgi:tRNA pseudouridine38-40 synthase